MTPMAREMRLWMVDRPCDRAAGDRVLSATWLRELPYAVCVGELVGQGMEKRNAQLGIRNQGVQNSARLPVWIQAGSRSRNEAGRVTLRQTGRNGSQNEAEENAVKEWPNGGMPFPKADIRNPEDFQAMAKQVSIENFANRVLTSADLDEHLEHIQKYVDLGFDEVYIHNCGRNQEEFIKAYGERVIPKLRWPG